MQKRLLVKALFVGMLMLLLGVPLAMIQSTISERIAYRDEAARSIAQDSVGEQHIYGPVLVMPYDEVYAVEEKDKDGKPETKRYRKRVQHLVFPNQLEVLSNLGTEKRHRGIHQVLMFNGAHNISGDFTVPAASELPHTEAGSQLTPDRPYIALAVADVRGVRDIPRLVWGKRSVEFEQGSGLKSSRQGLHAKLSLEDAAPGPIKFSFDLTLAGMDSQAFVPLARNNRFVMTSAWPHPQFSGRFLPEKYSLTNQGFQATWRISALASEAQAQLRQREQAAGREDSAMPPLDTIQAAFIEPVNVYSMADRATKYGLLFVALTFAAFFLFEVMKRLPIHPVQYLLVGLALALFFLLLVSLSEHYAFVASYLAASAACIALIGYYLAHVLHDWKRGLGFGGALCGLYGILFGLLNSENNALMLGAILLFAVLAAIMVATRKVDWYNLGTPAAMPAEQA